MMNRDYLTTLFIPALIFFMYAGCETGQQTDRDTGEQEPLTARMYDSGFYSTSYTYQSLSTAGDGRVYYVLSTGSLEVGGQFYIYDPGTDEIEFVADLTDASGEGNLNAIPQGKSHVNFFERDGKLYFATHLGYYEIFNGIELLPQNLPDGYGHYPGGHFLSYDLQTGEFEKLATAPDGEGIISMEMDRDRGQLYGISWPTGYFLHYDLSSGEQIELGPVSARGEAGTPGEDFRVIPRTLFIDSETGVVYYSTAEGDIYGYDPGSQQIERLEGVDLRLDYFGQYDPTRPGDMAYHWRNIEWYEPEGVAYGVHATSGYLFRLDPREPSIEVVERITSEPSKRSGMFDLFYYGYLGFELGPDGETLYYLTGAPAYIDGRRVERDEEILLGSRGMENLHLVTFHIPTQTYTDHGPILLEDGTIPIYAHSIGIGLDGSVYTLASTERDGRMDTDLLKIPNPFDR